MKIEDRSDLMDSEQLYYKMSLEERLKKYNIDRRAALFTIFLCILIDILGYSMILPLLPIVATQTFGASSFLVGIMIASNALATFIFAPLWGRLSDKVGRKGPLLISQLGTFTAFLILGFSNSISNIFLSRIFDGIFGGQIPIIRAFITDITDEKSRSSQMGRFAAAMAFGMIIGPSIGGLFGSINWRYPAYIASSLSLISIFLTLRFLIETMPKERIQELKKKREMDEKVEKKRFSYLNRLVLLRLSEILLFAIAFNMIFSTFALVLNLRYGLDIGMIGIFSTFAGVNMIIFGGILMKPLTKKFGEKTLLFFSLILAYFSFLSYPFLYEAWLLFVYVIPFMFMQIILRSIIFTNLSKGVEEDEQGVVSGWASNMFSIAQIISPIIGYWYLDIQQIGLMGHIFDAYFLMALSCTFAIVILTILILFDLKRYPEHFEQVDIKRVSLGT
ncbi:MAG: MFS transporter [Promethearchaeota archaeon]